MEAIVLSSFLWIVAAFERLFPGNILYVYQGRVRCECGFRTRMITAQTPTILCPSCKKRTLTIQSGDE